jgi:hypothetical protein
VSRPQATKAVCRHDRSCLGAQAPPKATRFSSSRPSPSSKRHISTLIHQQMPPRLPSSSLVPKRPKPNPIGLSFCPSCSLWRFARAPQPASPLPQAPSSPNPRPSLRNHILRRTSNGRSTLHTPSHHQRLRQQRQDRRRCFSAIAPATSINASPDVPSANRPLHDALAALKKNGAPAASYIDLSRLELGLRGLEGEDPVVRVAGRFSAALLAFSLRGC